MKLKVFPRVTAAGRAWKKTLEKNRIHWKENEHGQLMGVIRRKGWNCVSNFEVLIGSIRVVTVGSGCSVPGLVKWWARSYRQGYPSESMNCMIACSMYFPGFLLWCVEYHPNQKSMRPLEKAPHTLCSRLCNLIISIITVLDVIHLTFTGLRSVGGSHASLTINYHLLRGWGGGFSSKDRQGALQYIILTGLAPSINSSIVILLLFLMAAS